MGFVGHHGTSNYKWVRHYYYFTRVQSQKKKKKRKKKTTHKFTIFLATIIPIENGSTQVFNLLNYYLLIFK
jgi:hypothetical protein